MPPVLPDSLARLLSLLRGGFTAPTFDTFCWLAHGPVGRIGEHTITGVWQAARLGGVLHHSRAHDFFARRRRSAVHAHGSQGVTRQLLVCGRPLACVRLPGGSPPGRAYLRFARDPAV